MDFLLFVKIIAWIGLVVSGLLTALSVYNWYHYNFTKAGEFEQQLMRLSAASASTATTSPSAPPFSSSASLPCFR